MNAASLVKLLGDHTGGEGLPDLKMLLQSVQAGEGDHPVIPQPGFTAKTCDETGAKVFLNLCSAQGVALPEGWPTQGLPPAVERYLESRTGGDAEDAAAVALLQQLTPLLGPARQDTDHRGEVCTVLDCVLHPHIVDCAAAYRPFKLFLIPLAISCAERQLGVQLNPQYKLPKMRYKGQPEAVQLPHSVRPVALGPQGQGSREQQKRQRVGMIEEQPAARAVQRAWQHSVQYLGHPAEGVQIEARLPEGSPLHEGLIPSDVVVEVQGEVVRVQAPGCEALCVQLPLAVGGPGAGGTAVLQPGGRHLLVLNLPFIPFGQLQCV